jgi:DNA-binding ferritin-like protein
LTGVWFVRSVADDVAERARALDGNTNGTLAEFVEHARLAEHPGQCPAGPRYAGGS